jgi:AcrR family transcriptional regulator
MLTCKDVDTNYRIFGSEYALPIAGNPGKTKEIILLRATVLFVRKGYDGVSIRDLSSDIGMQASSLYNHFNSKQTLWKAVVEHAKTLYLLYFEHLDQCMGTARSLREVLGILFEEPKKMYNSFTCFAFSLIRSHQFSDDLAGEVMLQVFCKYSVEFISRWLKKFTGQSGVKPFDLEIAAMLAMSAVFDAIGLQTQKLMGKDLPYEPTELMARTEKFFIDLSERRK